MGDPALMPYTVDCGLSGIVRGDCRFVYPVAPVPPAAVSSQQNRVGDVKHPTFFRDVVPPTNLPPRNLTQLYNQNPSTLSDTQDAKTEHVPSENKTDECGKLLQYMRQYNSAPVPPPDYSDVPIRVAQIVKEHSDKSSSRYQAPYDDSIFQNIPYHFNYSVATERAHESKDVPLYHSLAWNDGRHDTRWNKHIAREKDSPERVDAMRRLAYGDNRKYTPPASTYARDCDNVECTRLSWNDGKYHNGTLLFENMDFLLRDGGVGGIFSTSDATLSSAVAVSVEDVENTLDLEVLGQIRQQAEEEKADWNLYFTQYYNVITSDGTPSNTTDICLCMLIVLVKYVRENLQGQGTAENRQELRMERVRQRAEYREKTNIFLSQLQTRVTQKREQYLQQTKMLQSMRHRDQHAQNLHDNTCMPLHPIRSTRESQDRNNVTRGRYNAENSGILRLCDRSVRSLQDDIGRQLHVSENSVHPQTAMPVRPQKYRIMQPSVIYNNNYFGSSTNTFKSARKIPDCRQTIKESSEHNNTLSGNTLERFQEISDLIDFNISRARA